MLYFISPYWTWQWNSFFFIIYFSKWINLFSTKDKFFCFVKLRCGWPFFSFFQAVYKYCFCCCFDDVPHAIIIRHKNANEAMCRISLWVLIYWSKVTREFSFVLGFNGRFVAGSPKTSKKECLQQQKIVTLY